MTPMTFWTLYWTWPLIVADALWDQRPFDVRLPFKVRPFILGIVN
jgi:hypothetical protein